MNADPCGSGSTALGVCICNFAFVYVGRKHAAEMGDDHQLQQYQGIQVRDPPGTTISRDIGKRSTSYNNIKGYR